MNAYLCSVRRIVFLKVQSACKFLLLSRKPYATISLGDTQLFAVERHDMIRA
ncbi:hypothetical protein HMPREF1548_04885 [Clostridium sp. KLE 1755]|nr:hypothetical protein HMPREF1548_04885 [Clostridium sp. KLE 1755]